MLFADGLFNVAVQEWVLWIIRIIATIGGAVVGWFVCDPLTRLFYRVSFRAPTPGGILVSCKLAGGAILAASIYYLMPLVFGGGPGLGLGGAGLGGSAGNGGGNGDKSGANGDSAKNITNPPKDKSPGKNPKLESVEVEIIKIKNFAKDGTNRYYLLNGAEPALSLADLRTALEKNKPKKILVVLTKGSFDVSHPDEKNNPNVRTRLEKMATEIGIEEVSQTQR